MAAEASKNASTNGFCGELNNRVGFEYTKETFLMVTGWRGAADAPMLLEILRVVYSQNRNEWDRER